MSISVYVAWLLALSSSVHSVSEHELHCKASEPWPTSYIYVQKESAVINCYTELVNDSTGTQHQFRPQVETTGMPATLDLRRFTNDTMGNNMTEILCLLLSLIIHSRLVTMPVWKKYTACLFTSMLMMTAYSECSSCNVLLSEPWPQYIFVPQESVVMINCIADGEQSFWSIELANNSTDTQYQFSSRQDLLNDHGVYELPLIETPGMPPTLRLLINDTTGNNLTKIHCYSATSISTTLFTIDPIPLALEEFAMSKDVINISWSHLLSSSLSLASLAAQSVYYNLTITQGSSSQEISLNETNYSFTLPEDAPSCGVYNFSVTAAYVGAIYTGASCSVSSAALSTMLPSLPSVKYLSDSISYHLVKLSQGLTLGVYFEPAEFCESYPVLNYSLEIYALPSEVLISAQNRATLIAENIIISGNLSENAAYSFRIFVSNSVGTVASNRTHFYTTDVQNVSAVGLDDQRSFVIECEFISGSDAQGCLVMLVGELDNVTAILTRSSKVGTIEVANSPLSYFNVLAFDIEQDGLIGTVAIQGDIIIAKRENKASTSTSLIWSTLATLLGLSIGSNILFIIVIFCMKQHQRRQQSLSSQLDAGNQENIEVATTEKGESDERNIEMTPNAVYGIM